MEPPSPKTSKPMQKSYQRKDLSRRSDSNRMKFAFHLNRVEPRVSSTLHRSGCEFRDGGLLLLIHPVPILKIYRRNRMTIHLRSKEAKTRIASEYCGFGQQNVRRVERSGLCRGHNPDSIINILTMCTQGAVDNCQKPLMGLTIHTVRKQTLSNPLMGKDIARVRRCVSIQRQCTTAISSIVFDARAKYFTDVKHRQVTEILKDAVEGRMVLSKILHIGDNEMKGIEEADAIEDSKLEDLNDYIKDTKKRCPREPLLNAYTRDACLKSLKEQIIRYFNRIFTISGYCIKNEQLRVNFNGQSYIVSWKFIKNSLFLFLYFIS
ncbi:hypothetical protein WN51_11224 [Melipona quadrifasciata]|uniref:Uncharacterized protein n=1 Tax=Melipona quadrifasciata TaxID=166423 RepID=A0A0N0BHX0_9HYME|nr:hypothetical protein WN51_11224 [Melipona quadrifasciata]